MRRLLTLSLLMLVPLGIFAQGRLGIGGSFLGGSPVFDVFADIPLNESLAFRGTFSYFASFAGVTAFEVDLSLLMMLGMGEVAPYFGAGGGAVMLTGGGAVVGAFTVNGFAGLYWYLGPDFGLYLQGRFLGSIVGGGFTGSVGPGIGLFISF